MHHRSCALETQNRIFEGKSTPKVEMSKVAKMDANNNHKNNKQQQQTSI